MTLKKFIALALSLLAVISFAGCKDDKDSGKSNEEYSGVDSSVYTDDLDIQDFDGYNFRMLVRPAPSFSDQYVEQDSDDPVESAVYKRNKVVEEMFNISISATESSDANYETDALTSILAGDDAYDLIFPHTGAAFSYATQGALINLNDVMSLHLEKPWWSQDIIDSFNVNGNLYILDGDISMNRLEHAMCMFFNKTIFDELGIEYPYGLVRDGEWTFDEFESLVKQGSKDLNGDGVLTPESDQFGLYAAEWQSAIAILYTGGQRIYSKNEEGIPELTLNTTKTIDIFDTYFELADTDDVFLHLTDQPKNYDGENGSIFMEGRAMFSDGTLGFAKKFRSMEDDFGILPLPKFEYEDKYTAIVNGFSHVMLIPNSVDDPEKTGAIAEALCAIGSRDVLPAFYEVSLKTKFARDNESEDMIDIIREGIIYDLGYGAGGPFQYIGEQLARDENHDFSSTYAASESVALNRLKQFNEAYGNIE